MRESANVFVAGRDCLVPPFMALAHVLVGWTVFRVSPTLTRSDRMSISHSFISGRQCPVTAK